MRRQGSIAGDAYEAGGRKDCPGQWLHKHFFEAGLQYNPLVGNENIQIWTADVLARTKYGAQDTPCCGASTASTSGGDRMLLSSVTAVAVA